MEDSTPFDEAKTTRELAMEGKKHLEGTVDAAYQILSSMYEELCNPAFWATAQTSTAANGDASSDSSPSQHDFNNGPYSQSSGGGALDEARLRYKASVAALRAVLIALPPSSPKENADEMSLDSPVEEADIEALEDQASRLRKEIADKNKYIKRLIDQLRELVNDIALWQSPCPV